METEPAGSPPGVVTPVKAEPAGAPLGEVGVAEAAPAGAPRGEVDLVKTELAGAPHGHEEFARSGLAGEPAGVAAALLEQLPGLGPKRPPVPPVRKGRVQDRGFRKPRLLGNPCRESPVLSQSRRQGATSAGLMLQVWGIRKGWTISV